MRACSSSRFFLRWKASSISSTEVATWRGGRPLPPRPAIHFRSCSSRLGHRERSPCSAVCQRAFDVRLSLPVRPRESPPQPVLFSWQTSTSVSNIGRWRLQVEVTERPADLCYIGGFMSSPPEGASRSTLSAEVLYCPVCAVEIADPLTCGDCSAVICRRCGTPLESPDELAMG
jgi:hypothetical protein